MKYVPDLDIYTQGRTMSEAMDMARDAICLWVTSEEEDGREIAKPSALPQAKDGETVTFVEVDFEEYRKKYFKK